jgi:hypothetical protein
VSVFLFVGGKKKRGREMVVAREGGGEMELGFGGDPERDKERGWRAGGDRWWCGVVQGRGEKELKFSS